MGSTNKTAHYELPQFVANDKPSWLGDINQAMEDIDTGIYGAKSSADGAQQTANNAVAGVASAGTRMDGIQTQLDTVATQANQTATTVTQHTSSIATNSANINTINSRLGSTDISGIGDGTVTGAIDAIAQGGGGTGGLTLLASVSGNGVKTLSTLLDELYASITNMESIGACSVLEDDQGTLKALFPLNTKDPSGQGLIFTTCTVNASDFFNVSYTVKPTGSTAYTASRASNGNNGASVVASGRKLSIYTVN